jgi:hypothetical protein
MNKLLLGEELRKEATRLCVSQLNLGDDVPELQRRVTEAQRHIREHKLWLIASISAIASVISAIAAWTAILFRCTTH